MSNIKDIADPNVDRVLIYDANGGCYWRQNCYGYTTFYDAGVFTRAEAYQHAGHCGPEKRIELHSVSAHHIPTIQAENAALREQLSIATGERDALRTAAAEWQALAENRLEILNRVFTAKAKKENLERAVHNAALDFIAEPSVEADALAAHDATVRAQALREAAEEIENTAEVVEKRQTCSMHWQAALQVVSEMADAAEKEAGNAGA